MLHSECRSTDGSALFDRVARVAARSVSAPVAFITLRYNKRLRILGTHGLYVKDFDESWAIEGDLVRPEGMSYVKNVRTEPAMRGHPIMRAAPFVKSLTHVPAPDQSDGLEIALTILNASVKWPFSAATTAILTDLAMVVGDSLRAGIPFEDGSAKPLDRGNQGFKDAGPPAVPTQTSAHDFGNNTAGKFLLSTLIERPSIRTRKDVSYMTLRTWSTPIKAHQIEALQILKADPDPKVVRAVAEEFARQTRKLYGRPHFANVVPIPCGHSRRDDCFSVQIAQQIAEILNVPCVAALANAPLKGSSHPSKSATLKAPVLTTSQQLDDVLLVDDVVSSGRHLELAVHKLREICNHITVIGWIGAR